MARLFRLALLLAVLANLSAGVASAQDADRDGIPDALEADLAARFVPTMRPYSFGGCYITLAVPQSWPPPLIYRARYPTKDRISNPNVIVITYQLLYDRDCGPDVGGVWPTGHRGDNEPFAVFLKYDEARQDWVYDSLSATSHWHAIACFAKEARRETSPPGQTSHHPNLYIGFQKHGNHTNEGWGGCPVPYHPDNDRITHTTPNDDLPWPSRLFNAGEHWSPMLNDLGSVRPEWAGQTVWGFTKFFDAGFIRDPFLSLRLDDWKIESPPAGGGEWDTPGGGVCDYQLSSTSVTVGQGGGSDLLSLVATGNWCGWRVESQDDWITAAATHSSVVGPGNGAVGAGNGGISYAVDANPTSASRVGTITIGPVTVTVTQTGAACSFSATPGSFDLGAGGGTGQATLSAGAPDCPWTASANASWITLTSPTSGTGAAGLSFSVAANGSSAGRSSTISVAGLNIAINQAGVGCSITLQPASVTVGRSGSSGTIALSSTPAGCPWTASSSVPWASITSGASGSGAGTVGYTVAANSLGGDRSGTLAIGGHTFAITQSGNPAPLVSLTSPATGALYSRGSTIQLTATATDADGINRVEFYANGTLLGSDSTVPYTATWPGVPGGWHGLVAKAFDTLGMSATSTVVTVGVNNLDTVVVSPTAPRVGQTATLTVTGGNPCGAVEVNFDDGDHAVYPIAGLPIARNHIWTVAGPKTVAVTGHGNCFGTLTTTVNVAPNDGPSVTITSPATVSQFVHPASVTVSATASDTDGVSRIEFYANGALVGTSNAAPFNVSWQPTVGTHTVVAKAYDGFNVANTSAPISITITHLGAITFNPPVPIVGQPTSVSIAGSPSCGAIHINYGDGVVLTYPLSGLPTTQSHAWPVSGSYTVTATGAGNCVGITAAPLTVNPNPPPSVALTAPAPGAAFTAPATVTLTAVASDPQGISRVEFYRQGVLIGTSTTAPFGVVWSSVGVGTYSLTAVAYDGYGMPGTSAAVGISVSNAQVTAVTVSSPRTQDSPATVTVHGTNPCGAVQINFGDGQANTYPTTTLPVSFAHTWTSGGYKTVTATGHGNCTGQVSSTIFVNYTPSNLLIAIDAPANESWIDWQNPLFIGGWAVDRSAPIGSGIDAIHVWAFPLHAGGGPIFLGAAGLNGHRPDVAAYLGSAQFAYSGYGLATSGLVNGYGAYDIAVYAHSTETGQFSSVAVTRVHTRY
jgi:Big-like domain-containing protein/BACON domain-containing protein/all-beta uncharacterized protein